MDVTRNQFLLTSRLTELLIYSGFILGISAGIAFILGIQNFDLNILFVLILIILIGLLLVFVFAAIKAYLKIILLFKIIENENN